MSAFVSAIIVAAGGSTRMGSSDSKQFIALSGKTVIERTLTTFQHCGLIKEIVVVCREQDCERIREIATLKVLGFRGGEVGSYISKEIFLLSLIGGVIGLPLGVLEHHFIMTVINMDMIMFANQIKLPTFLYAFGLTILFTIIVLFMTRRPLKKVEMIESLKSVE